MPKQWKCIAALHMPSGSPISAYVAGIQPGLPAWSAKPATVARSAPEAVQTYRSGGCKAISGARVRAA